MTGLKIEEWSRSAAEMSAEWTDLQQARVADWEVALHEMVAEQADLVGQGRWLGGSSDLLSILGKARKETFHSSMLAWLLWPSGRHGLGSTFLKAFLDALDIEVERPEDLLQAACETERARARSRADVVVEAPGVMVVVEMKVDAAEGPRQCARLEADYEEDGATFVFLTPSARPPTTASADGIWRPLSMRQVRDLLDAAMKSTTPHDAVAAATLRTYLHTLVREF